MDIHYNARTCPRSRELIIQRVKEQGQSVQEVAQSLGISERTVYKWLARYQAQGRAGLEDRSSRPARIARQTPRRVREAIYRLRRRRMVAAEIAARLGLARSTVARILQQADGDVEEPGACTARSSLRAPPSWAVVAPGHQKLGKIAGLGIASPEINGGELGEWDGSLSMCVSTITLDWPMSKFSRTSANNRLWLFSAVPSSGPKLGIRVEES